MKRRDVASLAVVAIITGFISMIIAGILFNIPKNQSSKVPAVDPIVTSLPDIKNDSNYQPIFNSNAYDPAQPVQIGNTQNTTPFNNPGQ